MDRQAFTGRFRGDLTIWQQLPTGGGEVVLKFQLVSPSRLALPAYRKIFGGDLPNGRNRKRRANDDGKALCGSQARDPVIRDLDDDQVRA